MTRFATKDDFVHGRYADDRLPGQEVNLPNGKKVKVRPMAQGDIIEMRNRTDAENMPAVAVLDGVRKALGEYRKRLRESADVEPIQIVRAIAGTLDDMEEEMSRQDISSEFMVRMIREKYVRPDWSDLTVEYVNRKFVGGKLMVLFSGVLMATFGGGADVEKTDDGGYRIRMEDEEKKEPSGSRMR